MGSLIEDEDFAALVRRTDLPLDEEQIANLRQGYEHLERLRVMLHRTDRLETDLALVAAPEFDT